VLPVWDLEDFVMEWWEALWTDWVWVLDAFMVDVE
jgi:hypothetical protein